MRFLIYNKIIDKWLWKNKKPVDLLWISLTFGRLLLLKHIKVKVLLYSCTVGCWPGVQFFFSWHSTLNRFKLWKYMTYKKKRYFRIGLSEHQNARCHFEFSGFWSRSMFELTRCRWRFSVRTQVRSHYVIFTTIVWSSLEVFSLPGCPFLASSLESYNIIKVLYQMFCHISIEFNICVWLHVYVVPVHYVLLLYCQIFYSGNTRRTTMQNILRYKY